jgi:hypothetical protein
MEGGLRLLARIAWFVVGCRLGWRWRARFFELRQLALQLGHLLTQAIDLGIAG